ncbi:hypothetical protein [Streptomyces sp. NPDC051286]
MVLPALMSARPPPAGWVPAPVRGSQGKQRGAADRAGSTAQGA